LRLSLKVRKVAVAIIGVEEKIDRVIIRRLGDGPLEKIYRTCSSRNGAGVLYQ
jgi:hypothetical protein